MDCQNCEIFKAKQKEMLEQCDSIFDAADDMNEFVKECEKECSQRNNENEESGVKGC